MRQIVTKLKPAAGFAYIIHILLTALLPALVFIFVRLNFVELAASVILLSKWRMLAVRPRHWPANIRANAVDIIVGLSFLIFMIHSGSQLIELFWAVAYGIWLIAIKPMSTTLGVSAQALVAQFFGLSALFLNWGDASVFLLVIAAWLVCYSSARHFLTSYDEPLTRYLSNSWAYFGAAMVWILSHWLLFYGAISQPTLLLGMIGFSLATVYYLDQTDRLSILLRRQLVFVTIAVIIIILAFSDWSNKAI